MSDVVLLRKLTRKSLLNFGKFSEYTVQQCIELNKQGYLRWVYFNSSNITFMDDILDEIKITENFRILKPSKNIELGDELKKLLIESRSDWVANKVEKKSSKINKNKAIRNEINDSKYFSKNNIRIRNHGNRY